MAASQPADTTAIMIKSREERPAIITRGYQQEMLDESLHRNIIIALDTGAGKTHIALLRMRLEAEREATKVSWFLAPNVTLCEQQKNVIEASLPVSVGLIVGLMEPEQWKDAELWRKVLRTHRIVVTTPQVLLDALRHGYVRMGQDISLIVFDEAHHATSRHPYRLIMKEFYFSLPERNTSGNLDTTNVRPAVMGLTASPIFGGDAMRAFREIESNLDCTIRAPIIHRAELAKFVHRPVFKHVVYAMHDCEHCFSINLSSLASLSQKMDIEEDPAVILLREQLKKPDLVQGSQEWKRLDQNLSKTLYKKDTFVHKGIQDFHQSAEHLFYTLGTWSADWFIHTVVAQAKIAANPYSMMVSDWKNKEKSYLLKVLNQIEPLEPSYYEEDILDELSPKVTQLVMTLLEQKADAEVHNEVYNGIIFVERRHAVLALAEIIERHPLTRDVFKVGCLLGKASGSRSHTFLDITRHIRTEIQHDILMQFRTGDKNLLICTAVAEEGIDIQACGSVIRWDPPTNMPSWAQSRGRARRKRSTYTLMFCQGSSDHEKVREWENIERRMVELYNDLTRNVAKDVEDNGVEDNDLVFRVEETGAQLTLYSAISHLSHFCSVIPSTTHVDTRPLFDVFPPDMPVGWHELAPQDRSVPQPSQILYGSTVTLPRCLPIPIRRFTTPQIYRSKISAQRHAAFMAYRALYDNGLLNEHLLPITSVAEPKLEAEVHVMLKDVEKRSSTAKVSLQMNPWIPEESDMDLDVWWCSEMTIEGIAQFRLFTRREPSQWSKEDAPILHHIDKGPIKLLLADPQPVNDAETIHQARIYTRNLFWCFYGPRMRWDELDFAYLLLPCETDPIWEERRNRALSSDDHVRMNYEDEISTRASVFGALFNYPDDITIVKMGLLNGRPCAFVKWRTDDDPLTGEEEENLRNTFKDKEQPIRYPLLVVRPIPFRSNFLVPYTQKESPASLKHSILVSRQCRILLLSPTELECAFLMPSILRAVAIWSTAASLSKTILVDPPMSHIPVSALIPAICAPAAGERENYQRLEILGDAVLKFVTCVQLLAQYPLWHEGYLSKKKDHTVANGRLAKANLELGMYRWIIRDRLIIKKWKPVYESALLSDNVLPESNFKEEKTRRKAKKAAKMQVLSTKILADVVEALIGACYLHGGLNAGFECLQFLGLGMTWEPLGDRITQILSRVGKLEGPRSQLVNVETMIGYTFTNKLLLIEALTHASYENELQTPSYERLEFLGDSVLDMIVTDHLFHAPGKKYSPGKIHLRRSAVVNALFLAYICLRTSTTVDSVMPQVSPKYESDENDSGTPEPRPVHLVTEKHEIYLWKSLLHSSLQVLEDQRDTFARFCRRRGEIESRMRKGDIFPWAALTRLQAPKFMSDMVESIIGAVYLDSHGDMSRAGAVQSVLRTLGILDILEWITTDDIDVLHPVSRVYQWSGKRGKEVTYRIEKEKGMVSCTVLLDGEEVRVKRDQIPVLSEVASAVVAGLAVGAAESGGSSKDESGPAAGREDDGLVPLKVVDVHRGKVSEGEVKFAAAEAAIIAFGLRDARVSCEMFKKRKSPKKKGKGKQGKGKAPQETTVQEDTMILV